MKYKILIVDDEPANLRALERLFAERYSVITATSGEQGLLLLDTHNVALIISDQRMPGMTGIEFLKKAAELRASTVRMLLTGYTDVDALVESINSGVVYRYITKPWSNSDMLQSVQRAVEHYESRRKQCGLVEENHRLEDRLKKTVKGLVRLALEMLDVKSPKISAHSRRTAAYAEAMGRALNLTDRDVEQLTLAAMLHEVAHVRMPGHLLARTTPLRSSEMLLMQDYFKCGVKLLADIPDLDEVAAAIDFQHDHFDGHASPHRLSGEQIPLFSRIIAIVDSYDEMREPSAFTNGFSHDDALLVLQAAAGRKYDPALVATFASLELPTAVTERREMAA